MWPWEHAIVGYLAYSLFCHLYYRESPDGGEAFAVAFASVLPDLIDKPLSWAFGVFESGYALGHSIFFAVPLAIAAGIAARAVGRGRAGLAFAVGYLLHLPSDVLYHYAVRGSVAVERVLWPVRTVPPDGGGFSANFSLYFSRYLEELFASDPSTYTLAQLGLAAFAVVLWLYDGVPVLRELLIGGQRLLLGAIGEPPKDRENAGR